MAWVEALELNRSWSEELDRPRFNTGFRQIAATMTNWPTPQDFFELLPPRPIQKALPSKPYDRDKAAANMERLRRLLHGEEEA